MLRKDSCVERLDRNTLAVKALVPDGLGIRRRPEFKRLSGDIHHRHGFDVLENARNFGKIAERDDMIARCFDRERIQNKIGGKDFRVGDRHDGFDSINLDAVERLMQKRGYVSCALFFKLEDLPDDRRDLVMDRNGCFFAAIGAVNLLDLLGKNLDLRESGVGGFAGGVVDFVGSARQKKNKIDLVALNFDILDIAGSGRRRLHRFQLLLGRSARLG